MNVYGVFLLPDPLTGRAITSITFNVQQQFGLVSAGKYPPHATLAGSVPIDAEPQTVAEALTPVIERHRPFPMHNAGIKKLTSAIVYDMNTLPCGAHNQPLTDLALDINATLAPLRGELPQKLVGPFHPEGFHAHMSLASHELMIRPELNEQVEAFIRAMPDTPPTDTIGEWVALYQFWSEDWQGNWWETLRWRQEHAWQLQCA